MPLEPSFGVFNATCDYALHGEVAFGSERIAGYGTLAWVEFEVKAKPPEGQTWTSKLSMVEVYPEGTETYAQAPDQSKIPLNTYEATYIIPEFSSSLSLLIVVFLTVIALLSRKLQCHLRRH